ncbi:MAG: response regulator transcription factor [Saprospiraceae bacterium]|nr:response regulator transcription factor [Saprospiraceae bacterium]
MRILLIEDEIKTIQSLRQGLEEQQWTVDAATDGDTGLRLATENVYDVIVSDIIMPGIGGLDLCRHLRRLDIRTPFLLLSALGHTDDKINGLEAGADDYLSKPFEFREFIARIKALARRPADAFKSESILKFADLEQDLDAKTVRRGDRDILLTPREFALLEFFLRNPGRVLSKTEIAEKVWDVDFDTGTNVIEVYVNYLRNKVDKGFGAKIIHTLFGQGYVLRNEK